MAVIAPRSPELQASLEAFEASTFFTSSDAVLEAAQLATGLNDFGPLDFVRRLDLLLSEVAADANAWKRQKSTFVDQCVKAASNRLRIQHYSTSNPDARESVIDRPINVVALPRSGSTHLENLLAADSRLRHLPVYVAAQPAPQPGEAIGADGLDPRWVRASQRWEMIRQHNPILAALHEHSPDHACGENELQMPDFASYQWEWLAQVPGCRDIYLQTSQESSYHYMREVLKLVAHQFPSEQRWMLKSNQHAEQLPALLSAYPDVTVVMIHRDPVATLQSLLTMRGLALPSTQIEVDVAGHARYWVDRVETMLRRYMRDRTQVPSGQLVEVHFADVMNDDIDVAQMILGRSGLVSTHDSRAEMEGYMASHPRGRGGRVVYDLEGDFGLDAKTLRDRFAFYTDTFGIRAEVK